MKYVEAARQSPAALALAAGGLVLGLLAAPLFGPFIAGPIALVVATGLGGYLGRRARGSLDEGHQLRRLAGHTLVSGLVLGVLFQAVPYGRDHTNPEVRAEPNWDSTRTRELTVRACFDCHSNKTEWPWYTNVAPFSWSIQNHVDEGRAAVNYSEWDRPQDEASESAEEVREGGMPLWYYTLLHSDASLSDTEKQQLVEGLVATFGDDD